VTDVVLETDRLTLRRLTMADLDALVELDGDLDVMRYISGGAPTPRPELAAKLRRWITDPAGFGRGAAIGRHNGGFVAARAPLALAARSSAEPAILELGYRLRRPRGQGTPPRARRP
jgi:RimJ/RimL family protein N-acetyltransferase